MWHFLERFDHLTWIVVLSKTFGLPAAVISLVKIDFLDAIENLNHFNPTSTTHMRRSSEQFYGSTSTHFKTIETFNSVWLCLATRPTTI